MSSVVFEVYQGKNPAFLYRKSQLSDRALPYSRGVYFSARFFFDLTIEKIPPLTKSSVIHKAAIFAQTVIFGTSGFTEKAPRFCARLFRLSACFFDVRML